MLFTLIIFILILSVLVFVHEAGHFLTAKKFGAKAEEFGFGFPPRICGWKKINGKRKFFWGSEENVQSENTIYSLNWIPIGGFVKIKGEDGEDKDSKDSFASKKIWQRAVILSAGVAMNVVLCAVCLMIVFMLGAPQTVEDATANGARIANSHIQIMYVVKDSNADKAGVMIGDIIAKIDGQEFKKIDEVQNYIASKNGQQIVLQVDRLNEHKEFTLTPTVLTETGKPGLGVGLVNSGIVSYPWYQSIWLGIKATYLMFIQIIVAFYTIFKNLFTGVPVGVDVAGPVGIAALTGKVARLGFSYILQFTALLSMNLAIINFLPFPALDGGRVLFLIIEKIRGRAVNQRIEQIIHTVGFALLMVLIVFVTGRDLWKFKDFFINIWQRII